MGENHFRCGGKQETAVTPLTEDALRRHEQALAREGKSGSERGPPGLEKEDTNEMGRAEQGWIHEDDDFVSSDHVSKPEWRKLERRVKLENQLEKAGEERVTRIVKREGLRQQMGVKSPIQEEEEYEPSWAEQSHGQHPKTGVCPTLEENGRSVKVKKREGEKKEETKREEKKEEREEEDGSGYVSCEENASTWFDDSFFEED